ncbi:MAG: SixA phosphatase family protein [Cyclobacteriaceae bacterium]
MKTLYLVRHAKSSWDFPHLSDFNRPLNKRGKKNAPEMGKRMAMKNISPDLLLASPAKRAFSTAKSVAKELNYAVEMIQTDESIYHAGVGDLLFAIQKVSDQYQSLMLFGHNPGFTDLANDLTGELIANVPTAGVVAIEFQADQWSAVNLGQGKMLFFDYPKRLG